MCNAPEFDHRVRGSKHKQGEEGLGTELRGTGTNQWKKQAGTKQRNMHKQGE
jgi:hypothetical protein